MFLKISIIFLDLVAQIRYFYAQALAMNISSFEE